jgi:hypothetical protein
MRSSLPTGHTRCVGRGISITIRRIDTRHTHHQQPVSGSLTMSRLADAEARLEAALQQLETALASRSAAVNSHAPTSGPAGSGLAGAGLAASDDGLDRAAIIAEISRIDEQLTSAMQMIDRARLAAGAEGGKA